MFVGKYCVPNPVFITSYSIKLQSRKMIVPIHLLAFDSYFLLIRSLSKNVNIRDLHVCLGVQFCSHMMLEAETLRL